MIRLKQMGMAIVAILAALVLAGLWGNGCEDKKTNSLPPAIPNSSASTEPTGSASAPDAGQRDSKVVTDHISSNQFEVVEGSPCSSSFGRDRYYLFGQALKINRDILVQACDNPEWEAVQPTKYALNGPMLSLDEGGSRAVVDVSRNLTTNGGTVDRHPRLSSFFPRTPKIQAKYWEDGHWTSVILTDPLILYLSPSGDDFVLGICQDLKKTTDPKGLNPWQQELWSRCQREMTPNNRAVIKTIAKHVEVNRDAWRDDFAKMAAKVAELERQVLAAGNQPIPPQLVPTH